MVMTITATMLPVSSSKAPFLIIFTQSVAVKDSQTNIGLIEKTCHTGLLLDRKIDRKTAKITLKNFTF